VARSQAEDDPLFMVVMVIHNSLKLIWITDLTLSICLIFIDQISESAALELTGLISYCEWYWNN